MIFLYFLLFILLDNGVHAASSGNAYLLVKGLDYDINGLDESGKNFLNIEIDVTSYTVKEVKEVKFEHNPNGKGYEGFKISYYTFGARDAWNDDGQFNAAGVPFTQEYLKKYNHAWAFRPQYLTLREAGVFPQVEVLTPTVGDFTPEYLNLYKNNCEQFWIHISNSDYQGMEDMVSDPSGVGLENRNFIVKKAIEWNVKGVDINFESFADYTVQFVADFAEWLLALKRDLNENGIVLSYACPSIASAVIANQYNFDYSSFIDSVDYITIMAYDIGFDFGFGIPNAPIEAIVGGSVNDKGLGNPLIDHPSTQEQGETYFYDDGLLGKFYADVGDNMDKLILGLPNYGMYNKGIDNSPWIFHNNMGLNRLKLDTEHHGGYQKAQRTKNGDLRWTNNGNYYSFNDQVFLRKQIKAIKKWFDNFEKKHKNAKAPHREIVIWYMGSNNPTPFDD